ncbi:type 1 glutamine amidotransferase domain-containing protein [Catenovulum sp. 2E275]|uniref:type 1 glutamine amidotransferase domain-containing protein n=1 Tax=Catenovulum sp. 2E275 TaxID=2980497 RepID=UPI0021D2B85E|nr:type 1 glutamine amidotransferase domain-containing protein [Catenovulum sp. 2E275]MCU4674009.1 type 1 glutamine amidotransferase domain-containing protein [Catenovulum sp. 2E275]
MKYFKTLTFMLFSIFTTAVCAAPKVLIVLTSHAQMGDTEEQTGFWLTELTHPYYELTKSGIEVDIASIKGGPAPIDPRSINQNEKDTQTFLEDKALMAKVYTTLKLSQVNGKDYNAVLYSGGHGTMWDFTQDPNINNISRDIYLNNGIVAALCHGPAALLNIQLNNGQYLIDGKKITGFTNEEEKQIKLDKVVPYLLETELKNRGAQFEAAQPWQSKVVIDQRIVTGQNPQSAQAVGKALVKLLK